MPNGSLKGMWGLFTLTSLAVTARVELLPMPNISQSTILEIGIIYRCWPICFALMLKSVIISIPKLEMPMI